jgi:ArsR family metal-binding transcriptional regulator
MLKKIYENFRKGIERIRWFANLLSERMNIEIAIFKLLYQSDEMTKKRQQLLSAIGERVVELKGHGDKNVFRDSAVAEALGEIEQIDKNISELRQKASEISRVTG